jgi:RNA polymerase sigma-70 factor (ECF subfamily)
VPDNNTDLLSGLHARDPQAAAALFERYVRRLMALAAEHLDARVRGKVDPEDVVQSVFRTFFRRHAEGTFDIANEDALWALLAELTLRRCGRWNRRFHTRKRAVTREQNLAPGDESLADRDPPDPATPSPEEAAILAETVEHLLRDLGERERTVCVLRLQGYKVREIARQLGCTEVTVSRKLRHIRDRLRRRCTGESER